MSQERDSDSGADTKPVSDADFKDAVHKLLTLPPAPKPAKKAKPEPEAEHP